MLHVNQNALTSAILYLINTCEQEHQQKEYDRKAK